MASHKIYCDAHLQPPRDCTCRGVNELVLYVHGHRIEVVRGDPGYDLTCPADLEAHAVACMERGEKVSPVVVLPQAFDLLMSCYRSLIPITEPLVKADQFPNLNSGGLFGAGPMLCRAVGVISEAVTRVSGGRLTETCQMPHGHKGECDWAAKKLTDNQLRSECERRFAGPVNEYTRLADEHRRLQADRDYLAKKAEDCARRHCLGQEGIERLSDVELREECARRGWRSALVEMTDEQLRAEFNRRALTIWAWELSDEKLREECNRRWGEDDCPMAKALTRERDEWKRVAESTRQKLERLESMYATLLARAASQEMRRPPAPIVIDQSKVTLPDHIEVGGVVFRATGMPQVQSRVAEEGSGIASLDLSPEPLAHLDEDLLADDAE